MLDTNVVLDLFVFQDAATERLHESLDGREWRWIATAPMREELRRVLDYPHIAARLAAIEVDAASVLASFDGHVTVMGEAARAPLTCKDADDQKFIDLAVEHRGTLLSKDAAVLVLRKRLLALGVAAGASLDTLRSASQA